MSKSDARNALLVGSYIATSRLGSASFVPELVAPGLSPLDIQEAAQELISDGLVTLPDQSIVDEIGRAHV